MRNYRFFLLAVALVVSGCTKHPVGWWHAVNDKAEELVTMEANYKALQWEHARLQKEFFEQEHEISRLRAQVQSRELAESSLAATGSILGRAPASIGYVPPKNLSNDELLALAYEHLREKRFPEAAVSFETYFKKPEVASHPNGDAFYSAGVAWFEIGNYRKARENFESARTEVSGEVKEKIRKKVDLWMRVIDRRLASVEGQGG